MVRVSIGHDGRHGAECFGLVNMVRGVRISAVKQHRRHECPIMAVGPVESETFRISKDPFSLGTYQSGFL